MKILCRDTLSDFNRITPLYTNTHAAAATEFCLIEDLFKFWAFVKKRGRQKKDDGAIEYL